MAKILLYGQVVEMWKEVAMTELWARGLDDSHIVEGITSKEMQAFRVAWDAQLAEMGRDQSHNGTNIYVRCVKCSERHELTVDEALAIEPSKMREMVWLCPECQE